MLRREYGKAINHIQAGITIFAEHSKTAEARNRMSLVSSVQLENMLRNLETHLCELSMEDRFPLMPRQSFVGRRALPHDGQDWVLPPTHPSSPAFATISEARLELDGLWHNLMFVLHELNEPQNFTSRLSPEQLALQLVHFRQAFIDWKTRFDKLTRDLRRRSGPLRASEKRALAQLEMYQMTGLQILDPSITDEMSWDNWTAGFERTLDLCDIIVANESPEGETGKQRGVFQLDHGIVTACFHTIRKCRSARVRYRALQLLAQQRQDGLWDAQLVQAAGRFIDEIERGSGLLDQAAIRDAQPEEIPVWRRIQGIDVMFSSAGRSAVMTFLVPASAMDDSIIPIQKTLTW